MKQKTKPEHEGEKLPRNWWNSEIGLSVLGEIIAAARDTGQSHATCAAVFNLIFAEAREICGGSATCGFWHLSNGEISAITGLPADVVETILQAFEARDGALIEKAEGANARRIQPWAIPDDGEV